MTMQYHVITTERCNLNCKYCGGTRELPGLPQDIEYDIEDLVSFIEKDPEAVIGFYGGEPLLALDRLEKIIDRVPAKAFTLQTNGLFLHNLKDHYLHRLHSILMSIDGPRSVTDVSRGEGVHDRVMENLSLIRSKGYRGDIIARMAFSDHGDIHRDVTYLLQHFDHVHWQLDVFWTDLDTRGDVKAWLDRYDEGISRLVSDFGQALEEGKVQGIVPFTPVLKTLLTGEPTQIRCGSGIDSFAIMTSGSIEACPIAPELLYSNVGNIKVSTPEQIRNSQPVGPPCTECDIFRVCGGRCLFANQVEGWGREWFDRVCASTRHMIEELQGLVPRARELMADGILPPDAFDHPKINNGCEIIP
ncbi:MAG: TIGR04084 family radical SAM/SPASM domain-containing protein [Candidatus Thermoplasmatota archaeon]|nr:TIGR04084 family radical SAM/SPASM domain-containing protein [Candidatus Thermoplasmatota archaeon]